MPFEHKPNTGSLFKNDRREKETHPNATGSGKLACPGCGQVTDLDIAAWTKEGSKGKYQSLSIKPKEQRAAAGDDVGGDEIPF